MCNKNSPCSAWNAISGTLFLAPMAGYTDRAFCSIALDNGADVAVSEMISIEALYRDNAKTLQMAFAADNAKVHAIQLFGSDFTKVDKAIAKIKECAPAIIDFNCGCPVLKIIKSGAGSALLKTPEKIYAILSQIKKAVTTFQLNPIPKISVKIRLGYDHNSINFIEVADAAIKAGIDMITLHGRTKSDLYGGKANWEAIGELKSYVMRVAPKVKVFGSGDLFTPIDGYKMFLTTNVDGIMYARGAIGNPWIFNQTKALLKTFPLSTYRQKPFDIEEARNFLLEQKPTVATILDTLLKHIDLSIRVHGEKIGLNEMKKHIGGYLKGIPKAKSLRSQLLLSHDVGELTQLLLTLNNY